MISKLIAKFVTGVAGVDQTADNQLLICPQTKYEHKYVNIILGSLKIIPCHDVHQQ
jgi:hypothetical protein